VNDANWITIAGANIAVKEGPLGGTWNTMDLTAGDYQLRLVVYDNQIKNTRSALSWLLLQDNKGAADARDQYPPCHIQRHQRDHPV